MLFMKKLLLPIGVLFVLVTCIFIARATPTIIAGSPVTVNNVTYTSAVVTAFSYNPSLQQYAITHNALQQTTDISLKIYISLNSTNNPVFIGTWYPANTNAATEYAYAGSFYATNYTFVSVTTTNSQQIYIGYGQ